MRVDMPEEGKNKLNVKNYHNQMSAPFVIYADFEALTRRVDGPELDPSKWNTQKTQHHEACGWGYVVVRCDNHSEPPNTYRGANAVEHFVQALQEEERKIKEVLSKQNL